MSNLTTPLAILIYSFTRDPWPSVGLANYASAIACRVPLAFIRRGWTNRQTRRERRDANRDVDLSFENRLPFPNFAYRIVPVNQKSTITCTAIANGGDAEWDFAFQLYLGSNVAAESSKLLYGLSCSTQQWVLQRFRQHFNPLVNFFTKCFPSRLLEWSLDPTSGIRRNDASSVFINVGRNPIGRDLTFDFIRNRWSEMVAL